MSSETNASLALGEPVQMMRHRISVVRRVGAFTGLALLLGALWMTSADGPPPEGGHVGFRSLLPAITTLGLVFLTREVISSLLAGVLVGGFVIGVPNVIDLYLLPSLGSRSYATILLVYLWALGGLIGLWTRTGGSLVFAEWVGRHLVRGARSARFFAWLMGVVFHQGGTISTILAGTTVRPVTDRHRVSHEELTYVVDSTASPVATVIPFNAWPIYVSGLVLGTVPLIATEQEALSFFYRSILFNFYGIFAVLTTLLFSLGLLPWVGGRMRRAIDRSRDTGQLDAPWARTLAAVELTKMQVPSTYRPSLVDFFGPMGTLLGVAIVPYFVIGEVWIAEAFGLAAVVAVGLAVARGLALREAVEAVVDGCKGVTVGAIILGLAVTLGQVSKTLGTAAFIVEATSAIVVPALLPAILMLICMAVAFSIGSSWGTYAVVFPVALPLAWAVHPDPLYLQLCFGAVMGGAVFGDQCSPISDTTILSSVACGADLMDHVTTQFPLALAAAGTGAALATAIAWTIT